MSVDLAVLERQYALAARGLEAAVVLVDEVQKVWDSADRARWEARQRLTGAKNALLDAVRASA